MGARLITALLLALTLLGCTAGCGGRPQPDEQAQFIIPPGVSRVVKAATRQADARIRAGEDPQDVVAEGKERIGKLAQAYQIAKDSPVMKQIWALVIGTGAQCDREVEMRRYATEKRECWRDALDGVPPAEARGVDCVTGMGLPDPAGLLGYFWARGGTQ